MSYLETLASLSPVDPGRSSIETLVDRLGVLLATVADLSEQADAIKTAIKAAVPVGEAAEGKLFRASVSSSNRLSLDKARVLAFLREQFGVELDEGEYQLQLCKPIEVVAVRCTARKA